MFFFNKELSKATVTRTELRNILLQNRSDENRIRYPKQRNFGVSLLRKIKKRYYENLNGKAVVDKKLFWKTAKPLLSENFAGKYKIHLIENNELVKTNLENCWGFKPLDIEVVANLM